jgi:hypothetical protein
VLCLGFVLMKAPEQCPRIVGLLAESFNPHVRYGAAMAVGLACAGGWVGGLRWMGWGGVGYRDSSQWGAVHRCMLAPATASVAAGGHTAVHSAEHPVPCLTRNHPITHSPHQSHYIPPARCS